MIPRGGVVPVRHHDRHGKHQTEDAENQRVPLWIARGQPRGDIAAYGTEDRRVEQREQEDGKVFGAALGIVSLGRRRMHRKVRGECEDADQDKSDDDGENTFEHELKSELGSSEKLRDDSTDRVPRHAG